MLKFTRNKLVSIERKDHDTLAAHAVLDDDIYSLEIDVSISISDLKILSIKGKWNRWTTPECPRSTAFLQEAIGFRIEEKGFSQKAQKIISRKACRHYSNLLLECCHSAKEAALLAKWGDETASNKDLTFEEFLKDGFPDSPGTPAGIQLYAEKHSIETDHEIDTPSREKVSEGMIIDLHVHTHPASPCSSVPVDQAVKEAKRIGLDGICITDHNCVWAQDQVEDLRQKHGFLVLRGNEITTDQGDMVVFGLEKDIKGIISMEELRREVLSVDGFIIAAHPFRGFLTFGVDELGLTAEKAKERPLFKWVDAIEVLNGKVTEKENGFASQVARGLGLPATGGSDAHEAFEIGLYATQFSSVIKDEKTLIEALKEGSYLPIAFRKERGKDEK